MIATVVSMGPPLLHAGDFGPRKLPLAPCVRAPYA